MKCICTQEPELRQTGCSGKDADLQCPVCPLLWWTFGEGVVKEDPNELKPTKIWRGRRWKTV